MNVETVLAERPALRELQKRGTTTLCDTWVQMVTLFSHWTLGTGAFKDDCMVGK
jgi:hypothetical protein